MTDWSVSFQEVVPGVWLARFHAEPKGVVGDVYVGTCTVVARGPKIAEVIGLSIDTKQFAEDDFVRTVLAAGDQSLKRLGFLYRFSERRQTDGTLAADFVTL